MCNVIGVKLTTTDYIALGDLSKPVGIIGDLPKVQSGFNYGNWAIIKNNNADIEIAQAHWEFIPSFIKDDAALAHARKQGIPWLNATAEKLLESKMFAEAALQRRCLIPVSYFFEWKHVDKQKIPYNISVAEQDLFFMAGIWQPWLNQATGEQQLTFAMVTTAANSLMADIHNTKKRMPTILPKQEATSWLFENLNEKQIVELASFKIPSTALKAHTVAKQFLTAPEPAEYEPWVVSRQGELF
jgi:putative SOS response-associated peptidase YedK